MEIRRVDGKARRVQPGISFLPGIIRRQDPKRIPFLSNFAMVEKTFQIGDAGDFP